MRLSFSPLPAWFPARCFMALVGASVLLSLCVVLPLLYMTGQVEHTNAELRDLFTTQTTLEPFVLDIRKKNARLHELLAESKPLAQPATLSETLIALQELASMAELKEAHFVPVAESVVQKQEIRLDGKLSCDAEAFRRFVLLLSDQPWIVGTDAARMQATRTVPEWTLTLWVKYTGASGARGGRP